jgi:hypothetical protein
MGCAASALAGLRGRADPLLVFAGAVPTLRHSFRSAILNLNRACDTHLDQGQPGAIMTDQQSGKSKQAVARKIVLLGAIATALGVINMMMNGSEAPSSAVAILQYAALALGLFALVGGLIMMVLAPSDSRP